MKLLQILPLLNLLAVVVLILSVGCLAGDVREKKKRGTIGLTANGLKKLLPWFARHDNSIVYGNKMEVDLKFIKDTNYVVASKAYKNTIKSTNLLKAIKSSLKGLKEKNKLPSEEKSSLSKTKVIKATSKCSLSPDQFDKEVYIPDEKLVESCYSYDGSKLEEVYPKYDDETNERNKEVLKLKGYKREACNCEFRVAREKYLLKHFDKKYLYCKSNERIQSMLEVSETKTELKEKQYDPLTKEEIEKTLCGREGGTCVRYPMFRPINCKKYSYDSCCPQENTLKCWGKQHCIYPQMGEYSKNNLKKCYEEKGEGEYDEINIEKGAALKWQDQQCCLEYDETAYKKLYENDVKTGEVETGSLLEISTMGYSDMWKEFTTYVHSPSNQKCRSDILQGVHVEDDGTFSFRCTRNALICKCISHVAATGEEQVFEAGNIKLGVFQVDGIVGYEISENGGGLVYGDVNEGDMEGALTRRRRRRLLQAGGSGDS